MAIKCLRRVIQLLNRIIPKNEKLVVFTSRPDFSESPLSVFNYMKKKKEFKEYTLVWLSFASDAHPLDTKTAYYKKKSIKGLWTFLRAKYIFSSHGLFAGSYVQKQIHVGLWHGMALKNFGALSHGSDGKNYQRQFTIAVATSEFFCNILAKCFKMDLNDVKLLGLPRNDDLLHPDDSLVKLGIHKRNKVVFWLPTYRTPVHVSEAHGVLRTGNDYELGIPFWDSKNILELDAWLGSRGVTLVIKIHMLQKFNSEKIPLLNNIVFLTANLCTGKNIVLYRLLACGDALITDYSSVCVDYLATNKPMAFVVEDIEKYNNERGLTFKDPLNSLPGQLVQTKNELLTFIDDIVHNDDKYAAKRIELKRKLNIFEDDQNTERVVSYVFNSERDN